jgi:hypothetical protein
MGVPMPKATLEFSLPEERSEYLDAISGTNYSIFVSEFGNHLRSKLKYETLTEDEYRIYDEVRTKFYEILNENVPNHEG